MRNGEKEPKILLGKPKPRKRLGFHKNDFPTKLDKLRMKLSAGKPLPFFGK